MGLDPVARAARVALALMFWAPAMGSQEPGTVETHHDRLLRVEQKLPGFGGMFIGNDGRLAVYLLDPSKIEAARAAIESVFGPSFVPKEGLRALRGRYTASQLKGWFERAAGLLALPGVTVVSLDEARNRVAIGLDGAGRTGVVVRALKSRGVPAEAVILEVKGPVRQLETGQPKK